MTVASDGTTHLQDNSLMTDILVQNHYGWSSGLQVIFVKNVKTQAG